MTRNNYFFFFLCFVTLGLTTLYFSMLTFSTHYGDAISLNSTTICNGNGTCVTKICVDNKPCLTSNSTTDAKDKNNTSENETIPSPTLPEEVV
jgi:hypothetical protein